MRESTPDEDEKMSTSGIPAHVSAPQRNWWSKNWKWFVPTGCATLIGLFAAFLLCVVTLVFGVMKHSEPYKQALQKVQSSPAVVLCMGEPIKPGWFVTGEIETSYGSGTANLAIPIAGPRRKGTIYVEARKSAGIWHFVVLQVAIDREGSRIDLLSPAPAKF